MRDSPPFNFDDDARMLKSAAQTFLGDRLRAGMVNDLVQRVGRSSAMLSGNSDLWREIVSLGWTGLGVTEDCGGVDASLSAIAGVVEEMGRTAAPVPLVSTLCASLLMRACNGRPATDCLTRIAAGEGATLAYADEGGGGECSSTDVVVRGGRLNGVAWHVQNACEVEWFAVAARDETNGVGWYVLHRDTAGLSVVADQIDDLTRTQGRVIFNGAEVGDAHRAAAHHEGAAAFDRALPALLTLVAADICGAAEWLLQTTTDYANTRTQFGRKIGTFQAVKHPLVDLMVLIDQAKSLTYHAAALGDARSGQALKYARMAKEAASEAASASARHAIQLHGGVAFTWASPVHVFAKRQKHNQMLFGNAFFQRNCLATMLIDPSSAKVVEH